ncbi:MAG: response regulator [Acidimicrobiales bacterium]
MTAVARGVRILVVDDEESYREGLASGLGHEGYEVVCVTDGPAALEYLSAHPCDLVLLDHMLPGMQGTEVCRALQATSAVPVIMLTARDDEVDVVAALELGASGYVTKPFRLRELIARIEATLRRTRPARSVGVGVGVAVGVGVGVATRAGTSHASDDGPLSGTAPQAAGIIRVGLLNIDAAGRALRVNGRPVHLTRREFDLLMLLVTPPGRVRTREEIIDLLWADRELADTRTLDTHVRRLRAKIEPDPHAPHYLQTVRGVGFRLEEPHA